MAAEQTETPQKCCGTCELWKPVSDMFGKCLWPPSQAPYWFAKNRLLQVNKHKGTTCPAWELKKESRADHA